MMQKAADALNVYMARNSTPGNMIRWARTEMGYVIYTGVTKTHGEDGRMLSTPVHLASRVVATSAPKLLAWAAGQPA